MRKKDTGTGYSTSKVVGRRAYLQMNCLIQIALIPEAKGVPDLNSALEDWASDSRGEGKLTHAMFQNAIFELADVWSEGVDAAEYVEFLDDLLRRIADTERGGKWPPEKLREVRRQACRSLCAAFSGVWTRG